MKLNFVLKILIVSLAVSMTLALVSCSSKDEDEGNFNEQSNVEKTGQDNTVSKPSGDSTSSQSAAELKFLTAYKTWYTSEAFKDFKSGILVTDLPEEFDVLDQGTEKNKVDFLKNWFSSTEISSSLTAAIDFENGKTSFLNNIESVARSKTGSYRINGTLTADSTLKNHEILFNEETRAIKFTSYNSDGEEKFFHEIIVTNDGYVAVQKASVKEDGKWESHQLLFKENDGYFIIEGDLSTTPESLYGKTEYYSGFAGKK